MKTFWRIAVGLLALAALAVLGLYVWGQPIQAIPGRRLRGKVVSEPVTDWSFINRVGICQLEVNPPKPRSVNVGCYGSGKFLYMHHTMLPNAPKSWAEFLSGNPNARLKFGENIYSVSAIRVLDLGERRRIMAGAAAETPPFHPSLLVRIVNNLRGYRSRTAPSAAKAGVHSLEPPNDWWFFQLESR